MGRRVVHAILERHRVGAVVIGAVALAAYHYVRQTHDVDLGVNADVSTLRDVLMSLRQAGFTAELREPDGDDPLGGVIDVTGAFGMLQIISFARPAFGAGRTEFLRIPLRRVGWMIARGQAVRPPRLLT
jgi:hypothetical protein